MIYFLKHVDIEGPGTLGDFFQRKGLEIQTVELFQGGILPSDFDSIEAAVILGGPMNVYEEAVWPFLSDEMRFIQELVKRKIMTVGICLGAQLIARALGARVYPSPVKETGFCRLRLTEAGRRDPVFTGVGAEADFFQWHEDTFDLPEGAELLLEGEECPHQAFRFGPKIYGFQFHMEVSRDDAFAWLKRYQAPGACYDLMEKKFQSGFDAHEETLYRMAEKIYNNVFAVMTQTF